MSRFSKFVSLWERIKQQSSGYSGTQPYGHPVNTGTLLLPPPCSYSHFILAWTKAQSVVLALEYYHPVTNKIARVLWPISDWINWVPLYTIMSAFRDTNNLSIFLCYIFEWIFLDWVFISGHLEVNVEFLIQIDKLVQLIESPIFTCE